MPPPRRGAEAGAKNLSPLVAATAGTRYAAICLRIPGAAGISGKFLAARGMPPATYVSVLTRAHLRSLPPLPKEEYLALKRTISELGNVGRNLNQIARAANQGKQGAGLGRDDFKTMFRLCEGLRDHVKGLLSSNLKSWEQGYAEPNKY